MVKKYPNGRNGKEGCKHSKSTIKKMKKSALKRGISKENRKKITKGIKKSFKKGRQVWNKNTKGICKSNSGSFKKGKVSAFKGKKHTEKARKKISMAKSRDKEFQGFKSSINKIIRHSIEYQEWRNKVFKRDNYTCQECGKSGCYIEAHHKKPVVECLKEKKEKLIFDVKNGITYCKKCHIIKDTHRGRFK